MTEFTRTPEHEEAVRRRFAVALGELSFEFQAIQQVVSTGEGDSPEAALRACFAAALAYDKAHEE